MVIVLIFTLFARAQSSLPLPTTAETRLTRYYKIQPQRDQKACQYMIYMYDLEGSVLWDLTGMNLTKSWGKVRERLRIDEDTVATLRTSEQWMATIMLILRLRDSACRTFDPQKADLFFAPILPKNKQDKDWRVHCDLNETIILRHLPHLSPENACRHFIFIAKTFRACSTGSWYYDPKDARLRAMVRLAYDEPLEFSRIQPSPYDPNALPVPTYYRSNTGHLDRCSGLSGADTHYRQHRPADCMATFPHVYSVPYPASIHFEKTSNASSSLEEITFNKTKEKRPILMLFVGHVLKSKSTPLRRHIDDMGQSYQNKSIYYRPTNTSLHDFAALMPQATFCLQPYGDSPGRKSISDAVALGCIPVFFGNVSASQYAWFFQNAQDTHIDIDLDLFMTGKIDLKSLLQSIPSNRIAHMQNALKRIQKGFTYSPDDASGHGDAVTQIFDLVHAHATSSFCRTHF